MSTELYQDDDETKDFSINFENITLQIIVWAFEILYKCNRSTL